MFWTVFFALCTQNGEKPNNVAQKLNISSGVVTKWKNGSIPNVDALIKLSDYYHVSIDYLLGRTDTPNIVSDAYIGGDNNGIQAVKNESVNISNPAVSNCNAELIKEFSSILSDLTVRERTELMTLIYKFADEHKS